MRKITCFQWLFHLPALAQVSADLPGTSQDSTVVTFPDYCLMLEVTLPRKLRSVKTCHPLPAWQLPPPPPIVSAPNRQPA
jgi:hypothetical protein